MTIENRNKPEAPFLVARQFLDDVLLPQIKAGTIKTPEEVTEAYEGFRQKFQEQNPDHPGKNFKLSNAWHQIVIRNYSADSDDLELEDRLIAVHTEDLLHSAAFGQ